MWNDGGGDLVERVDDLEVSEGGGLDFDENAMFHDVVVFEGKELCLKGRKKKKREQKCNFISN